MRNIYLVQPNDILANSIYLPYAVAAIASYAWQFEQIRNAYSLKDFIFKKDNIDDVVSQMESPFLVGFSSYMWSINYNLALAERIKDRWPDCIIMFGGPQIPEDTDYLERYPFIDILMHGEGEQTFYKLLSSYLSHEALSQVQNISYRDGDKAVTNAILIPKDMSDYPSPYAGGFLDAIVNDPRNKDFLFQTVLETNRGCPYNCIYCTWAGTNKGFRVFPMDRVKQDVEWIASHRIHACICSDSNFGLLDRDEEIADYIVRMKQKYGYPQKMETASAKDKNEAVFRINQRFETVGLNCGISVAVQSFSPVVLENIKRYNLSTDTYAEQLWMYRHANIDTYTDLILALPGETLESFCDGLFEAIERGQHKSINVHPCELLPNTVLYDRETIKKYDIHTVESTISKANLQLNEKDAFGTRSEVIVSTNTMTKADWIKAMRVSICVQSFHSFGLLRYIAVFLRKYSGISYKEFYMNLYNWIETESVFLKRTLDTVCRTIDLFVEEKSNLYFYDERFLDSFSYLFFKEGLFLCSVYELQSFYNETIPYLSGYFDNQEILNSIVQFQRLMICTPGAQETRARFEYNWPEYFKDLHDKNVQLKKEKIQLVFENCEEQNWRDYTVNRICNGKRENKMIRKYRIEPSE